MSSSTSTFGTGALARHETPYILLDDAVIARNYRRLKSSFGSDVDVFFAVKANNHPIALLAVDREGGSYDIASASELRQLLLLGIPGSRVLYSNPIKAPSDILFAHENGVRHFAFDTPEEIEKLAALAPGANVYVRLAVDNTGSGWPLAGKFGASVGDSAKLLTLAKERGLKPVGITFHVGSQCENLDNWYAAIARCSVVWHAAKARGLELEFIDIGGGIPAPYRRDVIAVEDIGPYVRSVMRTMIPDVPRLIIEPGRFLVAEAGTYVASVIGRSTRGGRTHVHLDAGLFTGLMEAYEKFWYPVECIRQDGSDARTETVDLVGPTCDSVDVVAKDIELPALKVGDRVVFRHAGAYTNSYELYNGFRYPRVHGAAEGGDGTLKEKTEALASVPAGRLTASSRS
jgi:ornithine decarboxylase